MLCLERTCTRTIIVAAALVAAACGSDADNEAAAPAPENGLTIEQPANDASAMESAVNAIEPAPVANASEAGNDSGPVLGETKGGDTGGNTVESNVSAM